MNAAMVATDIALIVWLALLVVGCGVFMVTATRPTRHDDLAAEWDELAAGPGPFILADGPAVAPAEEIPFADDSWIADALLNHPAVDPSYEDHVARALAIIEWPTHPAHRAEFSDTNLSGLLEDWEGQR